ncbi:hypothetical protein OSTOST_19118 [Ostertagia ostertagi]
MHMLETLLDGMREFLLKKETKHIQDALDEIRCLLDYDTLNMAIFTFSDSIQPVLRRLDIKPHWMFALSNLIQSARPNRHLPAQPGRVSAQLHVQDVTTSVGQRTSVSRESGQSELEIVDSSRPPSREEKREERKEYLNSASSTRTIKAEEKGACGLFHFSRHLVASTDSRTRGTEITLDIGCVDERRDSYLARCTVPQYVSSDRIPTTFPEVVV